jgi:hypothetical protein
MVERTPIGILEKMKTCLSGFKAKCGNSMEADTSVKGSIYHPDQEDTEFIERELSIYPNIGTERRATRGPNGFS